MKNSKYIKTMLIASGIAIALAGGINAFANDSKNVKQGAKQNSVNVRAVEVTVAQVISERLTEWDEFTGRIQAPQTVELRPRVSGYIDFVAFEEGSMVKAGDALFAIDNRQFKAEVKRLTADLANANSQFTLAEREYQRANNLVAKKAISKELLDNRLASKQQTQAHVQSVRAALELAKLNLGYTHVTAPIGGRVSNAKITKGNYVTAGQSILTSIVSTKEVYAYFDADEHTYLKYAQLAKQGSRASSRNTRNPVYMGLASDHDFPYAGVIDFVDNKVDPSTGTIRGRAVFDNKDGSLIPGLFARIKLAGSGSYEGILIDDKAIGTDLNNKYVLVLNQDNAVEYRAVTLGEKLNGLRIIKHGLTAGEKIVVNGLQRVRSGDDVSPIEADMSSQETLDNIRSQQARLDTLFSEGQFASHVIEIGSGAELGIEKVGS
jgi:multidrug efflux system membrane fusion protein